MSLLPQNPWRTLKEWLLVTLGITLYVLAWSVFLVPNNLVGGGVTGISSIIQYATHGMVKIGYSYFIINAILLPPPSSSWAPVSAPRRFMPSFWLPSV